MTFFVPDWTWCSREGAVSSCLCLVVVWGEVDSGKGGRDQWKLKKGFGEQPQAGHRRTAATNAQRNWASSIRRKQAADTVLQVLYVAPTPQIAARYRRVRTNSACCQVPQGSVDIKYSTTCRGLSTPCIQPCIVSRVEQ